MIGTIGYIRNVGEVSLIVRKLIVLFVGSIYKTTKSPNSSSFPVRIDRSRRGRFRRDLGELPEGHRPVRVCAAHEVHPQRADVKLDALRHRFKQWLVVFETVVFYFSYFSG